MSEKLDLRRIITDFYYFADECLWVQDKQTQKIVQFKIKPVQRRFADEVLADLAAGRPARYIVLKARREGISTIVQAIFFWLCCTRKHQNALTMSHHDDTTDLLFGMTERFFLKMPPLVKPMRKKSQRGKELEFANPSRDDAKVASNPGLESVLKTTTVKNAGAGAGALLVHLSEVALYGSDAKTTLDTILQVVPDEGGTIVVLESTARGVGNEFHRRWQNAEDSLRRGLEDFVPFFIAWFEEPTAVRAGEGVGLGDLDDRETRLRDRHGVSSDQLAWRRYAIRSLCGGSESTFDQEYPESPEVAFLSSGRPFFDQHAIQTLIDDEHPKPLVQGDCVETPGRVEVRAKVKGPLRIWQAPDPKRDYILVCDPSEGIAHGDPQSIYVSPRDSLEIVAAWHGHVPREDLGDVVYRLAWLYNEALVAVEMNGGWGHTPIAILRRRGYRRIYQRRPEGKKRRKASDTLGWDTTQTLRAMALDKLDEALRHGDLTVNDPELLQECLHFVYSETGKPQAEQGYHDDRVLCASILIHLWQTTPKRSYREEEIQEYEPAVAVTGY